MAQISLRVDDDMMCEAAREHRISFGLSADAPNAQTVEAIQEVKRMKANPGLGRVYTDVDQMMKVLLGDV